MRGYVILILRPESAHRQRTRSLWRRRNSKEPLSTPRLDHRSVADDRRDLAVHTARSLKSRLLGLFGADSVASATGLRGSVSSGGDGFGVSLHVGPQTSTTFDGLAPRPDFGAIICNSGTQPPQSRES